MMFRCANETKKDFPQVEYFVESMDSNSHQGTICFKLNLERKYNSMTIKTPTSGSGWGGLYYYFDDSSTYEGKIDGMVVIPLTEKDNITLKNRAYFGTNHFCGFTILSIE